MRLSLSYHLFEVGASRPACSFSLAPIVLVLLAVFGLIYGNSDVAHCVEIGSD
jgi:hypothetical protein